MSGPNGHSHEHNESASIASAAALVDPAAPRFSPGRIKELVEALEVPFDASQVDWRVTNSTKNGQPLRGQVVPYADQRAYTDRLNSLFTPAGWTRRYTIQTSASFERSKDQKIAAKVLVTCELTIFGLGTHSATGEEWADNDNAGTSAEAQAFKRASSCFGLGRYLYYFEGAWVDLDERKRPKGVPRLPSWATQEGWAQGLRPNASIIASSARNRGKAHDARSHSGPVIREIESLAERLGRGLYRGLLRDLAKVWSPREIDDVSLQQKVLQHMRAAERGLRRLEAALDKSGPEALISVLQEIGLSSLERVENLETLKRIVLKLESASARGNF
jgi:hypothetical protein